MEATTFEIIDRRFGSIIAGNEQVERLYTGGRWLEGPVYFGDLDILLFSDIPNDRILRLAGEAVSIYRKPAGFSNGHTRDCEGRLISCEHGGRRVTRTEIDGSIEIVADRVDGKRFNSPNDVVVKSDGSIWFTDPDYGIMTNYEGNKAVSEIGENRVYRVDGQGGVARAVGGGFDKPNGLAFSADERYLYIADSGASHTEGGAHNIRRFAVRPDNTLDKGELFVEVDPGIPDGVRVDEEGNVWTTANRGVQCYSADGEILGRINVPEVVSNLEFGGPRFNRLYMTATTSLYSIHLMVEGAAKR